jgi:hexosaminidase
LLSYYKINILHLHLSDDQGWRIEIKSWPNLTAIGGQSQVGGGKGGFYTQEQYKDIVAYAQSRFITIVPEIDLPGHTNAALVSYKEELLPGPSIKLEAGEKSRPVAGQPHIGTEVGFSTLSLKKESTMKFVSDVIREISAITPGPYFHVGGDEAAVTKKPDYIEFVNRFKEIVNANGKIMVGWEEIAQGDLDSTAITQYWLPIKEQRSFSHLRKKPISICSMIQPHASDYIGQLTSKLIRRISGIRHHLFLASNASRSSVLKHRSGQRP